MRLLKETRHRHWRRDLSAYIDGRLGPPRREALERHLAGCPFCEEELAALRSVVALLRRVPQVDAPRSFALPQAPSAGSRWPAVYGSSLRYATAAVAMLLLAVVAADLATGRPPALAPTSPGVAETQSKEGPERPEDTRTAAPATPLAGVQNLAQATPAPQPAPLAASENAQETVSPGVPPTTKPSGLLTLHNWFRWAEIALGAILAALFSVASAQWWRGRRPRER